MKKIKNLLFISCLFAIPLINSCTPDYVTDASPEQNSPNPSNPSGQSIVLNFTQGDFIGVLNNESFKNGAGAASRTNDEEESIYLLVYGNGVHQFNGHLFNKNSGLLSDGLNSDEDNNNIITIMTGGKIYTSTSGNFNLTQEQVVTNENGMDIIKCKFTFNGTFEATSIASNTIIENDVKINGTVNF